jgi:hypothetical protein
VGVDAGETERREPTRVAAGPIPGPRRRPASPRRTRPTCRRRRPPALARSGTCPALRSSARPQAATRPPDAPAPRRAQGCASTPSACAQDRMRPRGVRLRRGPTDGSRRSARSDPRAAARRCPPRPPGRSGPRAPQASARTIRGPRRRPSTASRDQRPTPRHSESSSGRGRLQQRKALARPLPHVCEHVLLPGRVRRRRRALRHAASISLSAVPDNHSVCVEEVCVARHRQLLARVPTARLHRRAVAGGTPHP